jgi:hypothetical protein
VVGKHREERKCFQYRGIHRKLWHRTSLSSSALVRGKTPL